MAALVALAMLSAMPVLAAIARRSPGRNAEVAVGGRTVLVVPLTRDRTFSVRTRIGTETLEVSAGRIRVTSSPCPRKICKQQSWVSRAGEQIVCVPGDMVVRVTGGDPSGVDAVSK